MKRFVSIVLGALGLMAVALISAFTAMRLAIHGREALVPPLTGLSVSQASSAVAAQGLQLTIENRFYASNVPAGHVIAQDPPAGFRVRRDWPVRITESLGNQRVPVPNLVGQSERAAMITIRQLGLEPGAVVHMEAPGDPDTLIAQSPAAGAGEMTSPRISLLVSDPLSQDEVSYVMPSLVGLTYAAAELRAGGAGLRLIADQESATPAQTTAAAPPTISGSPPPGLPASGIPTLPEPAETATVIAQNPPAGYRIEQGTAVHVTVTRPAR